jgi:hypothetical protein
VSGSLGMQRSTLLATGSSGTRSPKTLDAVSCSHRILVLPHSDHIPSLGPKRLVVPDIAGSVGCKLVLPPFRVSLGCHGMLSTAVPKAAIDEDSDSSTSEDDVGTARKFRHVHPISNSPSVKLRTDGQFRSGCRCAQARHELGNRWTGSRRFETPLVVQRH